MRAVSQADLTMLLDDSNVELAELRRYINNMLDSSTTPLPSKARLSEVKNLLHAINPVWEKARDAYYAKHDADSTFFVAEVLAYIELVEDQLDQLEESLWPRDETPRQSPTSYRQSQAPSRVRGYHSEPLPEETGDVVKWRPEDLRSEGRRTTPTPPPDSIFYGLDEEIADARRDKNVPADRTVIVPPEKKPGLIARGRKKVIDTRTKLENKALPKVKGTKPSDRKS